MFLARIILDLRSRDTRRALGDCQAMHRTVMSAFPDDGGADARRTFGVLYRVESGGGGPPFILVQSTTAADWTRLPDGFLRSGADDVRTVDLNPFLNRLVDGVGVRFRLLANPTRKVDTKSGSDGLRRNGRRVELRDSAEQLAWLLRKLSDSGFAPTPSSEAFDARATPLPKISGRRGGGSSMTFGATLFDGRATIIDADAARAALAAGIGTGKAYGFGLLSLAATDAH